MGQNYFNTLNLREQLDQLGRCRFMDRSEFANGCEALKGKKVVIIGCGAQGLNQGLNMRDSGLDVSYALREAAITEKRQSWKNATDNGFTVGTYQELVPTADLVCNLTPDKQHTDAVTTVMPLMKKGATLGANCTIVCGVTIGEYAFIGAGAVINKDVPAYALMVGVPAKQIGWMSEFGEQLDLPLTGQGKVTCQHTGSIYTLDGIHLSKHA